MIDGICGAALRFRGHGDGVMGDGPPGSRWPVAQGILTAVVHPGGALKLGQAVGRALVGGDIIGVLPPIRALNAACPRYYPQALATPRTAIYSSISEKSVIIKGGVNAFGLSIS